MKRPRWILFVAGRYFFAKRRDRNVASVILSVIGIALGVAALIVVIAVMNGFQSSFISPLLEISSYHVRIPLEGIEDPDALFEALRADPRCLSVTRFLDTQVMLKSRYSVSQSVNLRLVGPEAFFRDEGFVEALGPSFTGIAPRKGEIILGDWAAATLGVGSDSVIEVMSVIFDSERGMELSHDSSGSLPAFTVPETFSSGYYPIDSAWAIGRLEDAALVDSPDPERVTLGIKLRSPSTDKAFLASPPAGTSGLLSKAVSWREYNKAFFGALRMEKVMMYLMIALIFVVVAVNVFHSMRRSVFERHEEIGLLRGLGASPRDISLVFILEGVAIGLCGAFSGLCIGLLLSANIGQFLGGIEKLVCFFIDTSTGLLNPDAQKCDFHLISPDYFYINQVPVRIYFMEACFCFLSGALSAVFAAWAASRSVSRFQPQEILRYE